MKLDKRKLLGPLFLPLSKARHSYVARNLLATVRLPSQLVRARCNRPYFAVNICSAKGMGAVLAEALMLCRYAEINGLIPYITSTNPLYSHEKGENFIGAYLGPLDQDIKPNLRPMRFHTLESFYHLKLEYHFSLTEANRLFWSYFPPKAIITHRVNAVLANLPERKFDLSIHYRGTDKVLEASLISFEVYEKAIREYQSNFRKLSYVFLATDDVLFETFVRQRFPEVSFITYNLVSLVDAPRGRHFSNMPPQDKAIEALVNIFLLAEAPVCIRGASYMSAISKIINPELRTITLNRTHWGSLEFPEFEILCEE